MSLSEQLTAAYKDRTVLVTGHTGFKGGWLSVWLSDLGANVHGLALEPEHPDDFFNACDVKGLLRSDRRVDVRNYEALQDAVQTVRPEIVFHLAAQSLVRRSYARPVDTFSTNVLGTVHLLEALRQSSLDVCRVVIVTSDKCYENREWVYGYREDDPLGGRDPYSASKAAQDIVARSYGRSYFGGDRSVRLATARAGNVIGGGDWSEDRLVVDLVRAIRDGEPLIMRNPNSTRPWQHVLEPLSGYLVLGACLGQQGLSDAYNFGPQSLDVTSVEDLVDRFIRCWGAGRWESQPSAGPHEAGLLHLAADQAHAELGWLPTWGLTTAIGHTVRWYQAALAGATAAVLRSISVEQIREYCVEAKWRLKPSSSSAPRVEGTH